MSKAEFSGLSQSDRACNYVKGKNREESMSLKLDKLVGDVAVVTANGMSRLGHLFLVCLRVHCSERRYEADILQCERMRTISQRMQCFLRHRPPERLTSSSFDRCLLRQLRAFLFYTSGFLAINTSHSDQTIIV